MLFNRVLKADKRLGAAIRIVLVLTIIVTAGGIYFKFGQPVESERKTIVAQPQPADALANVQFLRSDRSAATATAAAFAESMPVRDMPLVAFDASGINIVPRDIEELREKRKAGKNLSEAEREEKEEDEINTKNREIIRHIDPAVPPSQDGALSKTTKANRLAPDALPTPSVSFEGLSISDTAGVGQSFFPPDPNGEVGPNHFVQTVNSAFRIWNKSGTALIGTTKLGNLFSGLRGPCASNNDGDPVVLYDQLADRWLISEFCWSPAVPNHQLIAISKTADPTGAYFLYDFTMPNSKFNDYPKFGVWSDGYYMTDNQFDQDTNDFYGAGYFAFDRAKMLAGDPTASYIYFDSCPASVNCAIGGVLPSDLDGYTPPPVGAPDTFAYFTADEFGDPQDGVRLFDFHADFVTPANSTFTERAESPVQVAAFDPNVSSGTIIEPSGTTVNALDPISDRLMFRLSYRNFGNGTESLTTNHTVNVATPAPAHAAVRYYQFNRTPAAGRYTVAEQQTFSPDTINRWMGSSAMNFQGDTAVGYSAASTGLFPSLRYAARFATDPPGTGLAQGEQTIISGSGTQTSSGKRWGDYSDITVDPSDDCTFWYTQEYIATTGGAPWRTRIAKFAPRACSVSPRGTIQGTATSCATGLPITGVSIDATGGYDRLSDSNGAYAMTTSPGMYDVVFRKFGYAATTQSGVSISDGGVANVSACLAPVAALTPLSVDVLTDDNIIDPNECNLVNITLANNGAAATGPLKATLTSTTPGVTIATASSPYQGIQPNDSQRNSTPFRISTDASIMCFTSINLRLTLTSDGMQPTVIDFTLPVGRIGDLFYQTTVMSGTFTPSGMLVPGSADDDAVLPVTAPFKFALFGATVDEGSTFMVGTNGYIQFVGQGGAIAVNNTALPAAIFGNARVVMPYWDDLDMSPSVTSGGGIFTEVTGAAPERILKIEWRARHFVANQTLGTPDTTFAVYFHEGADNFEFIYNKSGAGNFINGASATVGVQQNSSATTYNQLSFNSGILSNSEKILFYRPQGTCHQGSGLCPATRQVNVSGRVLTPDRVGLKNARVILRGPDGTRTTVTNAFGAFSFTGVENYVNYGLDVSSKRYRFFDIGLYPHDDDINDLVFFGSE